jgi:hypothetical protein
MHPSVSGSETQNIMKIGLEQSEFTPLESYIDFGPVKWIEVKTLKKKNLKKI